MKIPILLNLFFGIANVLYYVSDGHVLSLVVGVACLTIAASAGVVVLAVVGLEKVRR